MSPIFLQLYQELMSRSRKLGSRFQALFQEAEGAEPPRLPSQGWQRGILGEHRRARSQSRALVGLGPGSHSSSRRQEKVNDDGV